MAPERGVNHFATLEHLLAGKGDKVLVEVTVVSRVKPHSVGPGHHVVFDDTHDIRMAHAITHAESRHTKDF